MKRTIAWICVLMLLLGCAACNDVPANTPSDGSTTSEKAPTTTAQNGGGTTDEQSADDTTVGGNSTTATDGQGVSVTDAQGSVITVTTTLQGGTNTTTQTGTGTTTATAEGSGTTTATGTTTRPTGDTTNDPIVFRETTVLDTAQCLIRVTGLEPNHARGYAVRVLLENRSATPYYFSVDDASVNKVVLGPMMAVEVAAGETVEETIVLSDGLPKGVDIGDYTDIALDFSVTDANDWTAAPIAEVVGRVYPKGEDKARAYRREPQPSDRVLLDTDVMTVIAVNTAENTAIGYYYSDIYFVNKTADDALLSMEDTTINGLVIQPRFGSFIKAGYATFGRVVWMNNTLEAARIDEVEEIRFTLCAYAQSVLENVKDDTEELPHLLKETLAFQPQ